MTHIYEKDVETVYVPESVEDESPESESIGETLTLRDVVVHLFILIFVLLTPTHWAFKNLLWVGADTEIPAH